MSLLRSMRACFRRLANLLYKRQRDSELAAELESHVQLHIEDNLRRGMTPEAACRDALIKLGGVEQTKERYRDRRGLPFLETAYRDIRIAFRTLRKSPGFTATVVLTLALGISANTAIFQLLDSVRLRSMPVPNPQGLVEVRVADGNGGMGISAGDNPQMTNPLGEELRDHQAAFSGIFAWGADTFSLGNGPNARNVRVLRVSGGFFPVIGITPARGDRTLGLLWRPGRRARNDRPLWRHVGRCDPATERNWRPGCPWCETRPDNQHGDAGGRSAAIDWSDDWRFAVSGGWARGRVALIQLKFT